MRTKRGRGKGRAERPLFVVLWISHSGVIKKQERKEYRREKEGRSGGGKEEKKDCIEKQSLAMF